MNSPAERSRLARILSAPLLHFFLIGGALFAASVWMRPEETPRLVVSQADVERISETWRRSTGRAPNERELAIGIDQFIDEELLIREARRLGWDRDDSVIQHRLIRNLRFLDAETTRSDAQLLAQARKMGMDQSDIVVRRRLLERARLAIASGARREEPTEAALESWWAAHPEDFVEPARSKLSHVFLSRDRRGDALHPDARSLAQRLGQEAIPPAEAVALGDPLLVPSRLPLLSQRQLSDRLGPEFAASVFASAATLQWIGPIDSSYGLHVVWVEERFPSGIAPLESVRKEVRAAIFREREARALRRTLDSLRARVELEIVGEEVSASAPAE